MASVRTEPELEYHSLKMKEYRRNDRDKFLARERASRAKAKLQLGADGWKQRARRYNLWHKYKITPEQYDAMLASQNAKCAICGDSQNVKTACGRGHSGRLHVDHDHKTGEIRGLLCNVCNQGMIAVDRIQGWFAKAAEYAARKRGA